MKAPPFFRALLRNRTFTFINLLGLVLGFVCCLLIGTYVQHELSFDRYHQNKDRLYRLAAQVEGSSYGNGIAKVSGPWAAGAGENIPEVEDACRFVFFGQALVSRGEQRFYESGGLLADASVFNLFSWNLIRGDEATALVEPNTVVLTETLARRYFDDEDPVGQDLTFDNETKYRVTGLMPDVPANSHFRFDFLASLSSYHHPDENSWTLWNQYYTYLLLRSGADPAIVARKFDNLLARHLEPADSEAYSPLLQPVAGIHLHSNLHREMAPNSSVAYVYVFGAIALFILLMAGLNFINLSTALAADRAREVGVRKVTGASRRSLALKFFGESLFLCVAAALLAVAAAPLALAPLNAFMGWELRLDLGHNPALAGGLAAATVLVALLAGGYPALVLSAFRPVDVLKSKLTAAGGEGLRRALVGFQFGVAAFLLVAALTAGGQLKYIQRKNLGFDKEQIVVVPLRPELVSRAATIKEEIAGLPGVLRVSASANRPGGSDFGVPYQAPGLAENEHPPMRCLVIDADFLDTYGMDIARGRAFRADMPTDTGAYLINEEAARQLGWADPVGRLLAMPAIDRPAAPVVGVVRDFHFRSMHERIAPLYFFMEPAWFSQLSVKLRADELEETLARLEEKWAEIDPAYPFSYSFFDEGFESLHRAEQRTAAIVRWFTVLAIFITCLGLFGLSIHAVRRRTREIGIRKVLGASAAGIVLLLSREVLRLVLVALVVALPLARYAAEQWLQQYAYRVDTGWEIFVLTAVLALGIAFLTVSFQSVKAALANPVVSLRNE